MFIHVNREEITIQPRTKLILS